MDRNKRWKLTEAERKTVDVWKRFIIIFIFINRNDVYLDVRCSGRRQATYLSSQTRCGEPWSSDLKDFSCRLWLFWRHGGNVSDDDEDVLCILSSLSSSGKFHLIFDQKLMDWSSKINSEEFLRTDVTIGFQRKSSQNKDLTCPPSVRVPLGTQLLVLIITKSQINARYVDTEFL